jgi:hypothetical protein
MRTKQILKALQKKRSEILKRHQALTSDLERVHAAIIALADRAGENLPPPLRQLHRVHVAHRNLHRRMSAAARKKISLAAKRRWAAAKSAGRTTLAAK